VGSRCKVDQNRGRRAVQLVVTFPCSFVLCYLLNSDHVEYLCESEATRASPPNPHSYYSCVATTPWVNQPCPSSSASVTHHERCRIVLRGLSKDDTSEWVSMIRATPDPRCGRITNGEKRKVPVVSTASGQRTRATNLPRYRPTSLARRLLRVLVFTPASCTLPPSRPWQGTCTLTILPTESVATRMHATRGRATGRGLSHSRPLPPTSQTPARSQVDPRSGDVLLVR
jgi:hypothetical protein